ncbi:MAG: hypothetical protein QOE73_1758 [Verrucomicrobiota bacterium]
MAGAPFDVLERLGTPQTISLARELVARKTEFVKARTEVERFFQSRERLLSEEAFRSLRIAVRLNRPPLGVSGKQPSFFTNFAAAAGAVDSAEARLDAALEAELSVARAALWEASRKLLPRLLVFGLGGVRELMTELLTSDADSSALPRRKSRVAERERHLLLYLQRIAAKNDGFSEFGPTGWGKIDKQIHGVKIDIQPGIAARETFLERWTAHATAAAMNADPEIFPELSPRRNPNGRIDQGKFVFTESGESVDLDSSQFELVERCDGATPIHGLGAPVETVRALVDKKVLRCQVEVAALEPHAFAVLRDDVTKWRAGPTRERWLSILQPLAELPQKFGATARVQDRHQILQEARDRLQSLGAALKSGERHLYSATNPIGEECSRESGFSINEELINEVTVDAAPWIDLWRDSYAFVASRVAAGLRPVLQKIVAQNGAAPLPAFLQACEATKLPLDGPGLVALAHMAFQEVKTAFREMMKAHAHQPEYELTPADCHFVRENFQYSKFDEYTFPSADLQMSARSPEAVATGDYQWILAELHPPAALLHHGAYWSCPDKASLNQCFAATIGGKPNFYFGFYAADFTSHTTVRIFDALPDFSNFVAPQRGNPKWRTVAPADAEVYVDQASGDVCVRQIGSHEHLGSFARAWLIPLGFHPFQFGLAPHMPRLRCGRVIVQRRAWTVTREELAPGDYTGVSRDLVLAIERLRAQRDLPRYVYIRPTEQTLRRSGAEGRDKDTKPVFIDLESYLFLEIFHRWLVKAGELEVTEMLPDPDHLLWPDADGRRTFELRTMIVPRP